MQASAISIGDWAAKYLRDGRYKAGKVHIWWIGLGKPRWAGIDPSTDRVAGSSHGNSHGVSHSETGLTRMLLEIGQLRLSIPVALKSVVQIVVSSELGSSNAIRY